jgi:hypothetical protein
MKRLVAISLLVAVSAFGYCIDFSVNSPECLQDERSSWPAYSNGEQYYVGSIVCRGYIKTPERTYHMKQGIPMEFRAHRKACRTVEKIEKKKRGEPGCCARIYDVGTALYKDCLVTDYGHCSTVVYYIVTFSRDLVKDVSLSEESMSWNLQEDPNIIMIGDSVDVFRDDGTLKYRGYISIQTDGSVTEPVRTAGFCYDRKSGKPTRRVNNVSLCN